MSHDMIRQKSNIILVQMVATASSSDVSLYRIQVCMNRCRFSVIGSKISCYNMALNLVWSTWL